MLGSSRRLWTLMCSEEKGVVDDGGEFGLGINLLELAGLVDDLVGALVNVAAGLPSSDVRRWWRALIPRPRSNVEGVVSVSLCCVFPHKTRG